MWIFLEEEFLSHNLLREKIIDTPKQIHTELLIQKVMDYQGLLLIVTLTF